jgi:hypothetical protein
VPQEDGILTHFPFLHWYAGFIPQFTWSQEVSRTGCIDGDILTSDKKTHVPFLHWYAGFIPQLTWSQEVSRMGCKVGDTVTSGTQSPFSQWYPLIQNLLHTEGCGLGVMVG